VAQKPGERYCAPRCVLTVVGLVCSSRITARGKRTPIKAFHLLAAGLRRKVGHFSSLVRGNVSGEGLGFGGSWVRPKAGGLAPRIGKEDSPPEKGLLEHLNSAIESRHPEGLFARPSVSLDASITDASVLPGHFRASQFQCTGKAKHSVGLWLRRQSPDRPIRATLSMSQLLLWRSFDDKATPSSMTMRKKTAKGSTSIWQ